MHPFIFGNQITYYHPNGELLFENLNFQLGSFKVGLVGHNGVGKSTLLKLVLNKVKPSSGKITTQGLICTVEQTAEPPKNILVTDLFPEMETYEKSILLGRVGLSDSLLPRELASLSGGEWTRIQIAHAIGETPDCLLLDEPTNNLDGESRQFLYNFIRSWKRGLLVVSHDRELLQLVDKIWELSSLGLKIYGGNYDFFSQQIEREQEAAKRKIQSSKTKLKIAQQKAQVQKEKQQKRSQHSAKKARKTGVPKMILGNLQRKGQETSSKISDIHEKKLEFMKDDLAKTKQTLRKENNIKIDLQKTYVPTKKKLIELEKVIFRYPNQKENLWKNPITFALEGPQRIALKGNNGSGKSTLLKLIIGELQPRSGYSRSWTTRITYLDQKISLLEDNLSLLENFKKHAPKTPEHQLRIRLGRLLFEQDKALKKTQFLSGGERLRAGLLCSLLGEAPPQLLILDEPTNNLDLNSLIQLENLLVDYQGAFLIVSHDDTFLDAVNIQVEWKLAKDGMTEFKK